MRVRNLKRCSKCKAPIQHYSKTGMCRHCWRSDYTKKRREKNKKLGRCIDCGKKHETLHVRCPSCKLKNYQCKK